MVKALLAGILAFIGLVGFVIYSQFLSLSWDKSELPKMDTPRIIIKKKARTLEVLDGDKSIAIYKIALGFEPEGDKEMEGDGKTPEGDFFIHTKNSKSKFYLSLGISYPNIEDAKRGLAKQLISREEHNEIVKAILEKRMPLQNTKLGGEIYLHGKGNLTDWTAGCVALRNKDMKALFDSMPLNTPVRIEP